MTKIQFGRPAEFLMSQEGFTKYDSPDAMVTELVRRQHSISRKEGSTFGYPANIERVTTWTVLLKLRAIVSASSRLLPLQIARNTTSDFPVVESI